MYQIEYSIESVINNHYKFDDTKQLLIYNIKEKFDFFIQKAQSFVVEDYVENERICKDLYI